MPQLPNIQPADLYSMYSGVGSSIANATSKVGDAIDAYRTVEAWKNNEQMRLKARQAIISEYKFDDSDIPQKASLEELGRIAHNLQTIDSALDQAAKVGATGVADRDLAHKVALSDKDYFYKALGETQAAIQKATDEKAKQEQKALETAKTEAEQQGAAATLQGVSSGLKAGGFENAPPTISSGGVSGEVLPTSVENTSGRREISQAEYTGRSVAGRKGSKVGSEVTKEAAQAGFVESIPNPEKVGAQTQEAYLGQFRTKDEILAANKPNKKGGGAEDEIKNAQVVTFYNQARKAKADKEKEKKKAEDEVAELERNLDSLTVQKKTIKVGGEYIAPTDSASVEKFRTRLNTAKGELEGHIADLETYQGEYEAWAQEMRDRGLPISEKKPIKAPAVGGGEVTPSSRSDVSGAAIPSATIELAKKAIAPGSGATPAQIEQAKRILAAAGIH